MNKKQRRYVWVYNPQPPKFKINEKEAILSQVRSAIKLHPKLSQKVSRVDMRANRI